MKEKNEDYLYYYVCSYQNRAYPIICELIHDIDCRVFNIQHRHAEIDNSIRGILYMEICIKRNYAEIPEIKEKLQILEDYTDSQEEFIRRAKRPFIFSQLIKDFES